MSIDRWSFGAGLGLILFGMDIFEESIKKLGGSALGRLLQRYTNNPWQTVVSSAVITGILNSSTLVSLLTLGFVGAGMMPLINAVAVIIGANIGSTATGMIVALLGTSELNISVIAFPLISAGALILLVTQKKYWAYWARLCVGFGLFFLGIGLFKNNIDSIKSMFDLTYYADMNLWFFGFIGMIVTAIVHSSGAVGVMTLAALSSGIIGFEASFAIILGANIGTTFSSLVAGMHGSRAKRQIGIANVLFNIITVVVGIVLFYPYIRLTLDVLGYRDDLVMGNAMINFIFNLTTSLLFVPVIPYFTRLIVWLVPNDVDDLSLRISKLSPDPDQKNTTDMVMVSLDALRQDTRDVAIQVMGYVGYVWGLEFGDKGFIALKSQSFDNDSHLTMYEHATNRLDYLLAYSSVVGQSDIAYSDREQIAQIVNDCTALSNACLAIEHIRKDILVIRTSADSRLMGLYKSLLLMVEQLPIALHNKAMDSLVDTIKAYRKEIVDELAFSNKEGKIAELSLSSIVSLTGEFADCIKSFQKLQSSSFCGEIVS